MWVYLLGVFFLLPCAVAAEDDECPELVDGCYNFNVISLDLEKVKNCLREHLTERLQSGEDININTIITPIKEINADDHSTTFTSEHTAKVTTTSITSTSGTEVPSSTTVLYSPAMTGATDNPGANRSSTTVLSSLTTTETTKHQENTPPPSITALFSSSQTQATNQPGVESQGVSTNVNVTAEYGITSCPPYCGSINETSYINHTWCVVKQNHCKCNGSILELEKYSTETAHVCMKPLQKDCPSTCEFYVKNSQFFNSSTVYPTISAPGLRNVICECANGSESGLPSTYGWLIIQRRLLNGTIGFKESSKIVDYETAVLNDRTTHYWFGLINIHILASKNASLQIEFGKRNSTGLMEYFFVRYSHFSIGDKSSGYRLNVIEQPHCGNDTNRLPDNLDPKSVRPVFAVRNGSGWWFYNNSGLDFNLNAKWNNGIRWGNQTYDTVVIKILPGGAEKVLCVNFTETFLILQCPQSCSSTKSSVHQWCVRDSCICDRPRERWNDITDTSYKADNCFVPFGDNCSEVCQNCSDLKKLSYPTETLAYKKINGGTYAKVYCKCSDENTGQLVIWHKGTGSFPVSLYYNDRFDKDKRNWIDEKCVYANYSRTTTPFARTFCINDKCQCDRSWLAANNPTDRNICKVPLGVSCSDACQNWSHMKTLTYPIETIAYIKIDSQYEKVYCNCSYNDSGWMVVWHEGYGNFPETQDYNETFEDENGYYWIGFDLIGRLTDQYNASLLLIMRKNNGATDGNNIKYGFLSKKKEMSDVNLCIGSQCEDLRSLIMNNDDVDRYDVIGMKIMIPQVLCPVAYEDKCFFPFTELEYKCGETDGTELCKSIGGHLANIYSKEHMDDVVKFVRSHRMSDHDGMDFQLGMAYQNETLLLHNGTEANTDYTEIPWQNVFSQNIVTLRVPVREFQHYMAVSLLPSSLCNALCEIEKA